jgi:hypothetical protein
VSWQVTRRRIARLEREVGVRRAEGEDWRLAFLHALPESEAERELDRRSAAGRPSASEG